MDSAAYLVEVTTVQGGKVFFGPYPSEETARSVVAEFRPRIGSDEMVFSNTVTNDGRPTGMWSMAGRGIAGVQVVRASSAPRPSGRLHHTRWSH